MASPASSSTPSSRSSTSSRRATAETTGDAETTPSDRSSGRSSALSTGWPTDEILAGFEPPPLSPQFAESLFADRWGLTGTIERLVGERTANFRLRTESGPDYVMHVQRATGGRADEVFDMQTRAIAHAGRNAPDRLPSTASVAAVVEVDSHPWVGAHDGDTPLLARVVTFLDGVTFGDAGELTTAAYADIGQLVGGLASALADFEHAAANHPMPWDIANRLIVDDSMWALLDKPTTADLVPLRVRLERVAATMDTLPRQTIHNDVHIGNLVRANADSSAATGVIDFGDVVETVRAADIAITAESFAPLHHDPIAVTAALVAGYRRAAPLTDTEIDAIGELVLARFALTVLLFAHHIRSVPRLGERAAQAMPSARDRLVRWAQLDPDEVTVAIRRAIERDTESST